MTASPLDPLRHLFGEQLEGLAGGVVSGEVPLTADVVNRLIARKLSASEGPITRAEVEILDNDALTVRLQPRGPIPLLTVDAHIEQQPQLPERPVFGIRWSLRGMMGAVAMFAAPVVGMLGKLPPGLHLERDRLWVDIHALLRSQGLGDLVPLLTGVRVLTREHRFVIQFEIRR